MRALPLGPKGHCACTLPWLQLPRQLSCWLERVVARPRAARSTDCSCLVCVASVLCWASSALMVKVFQLWSAWRSRNSSKRMNQRASTKLLSGFRMQRRRPLLDAQVLERLPGALPVWTFQGFLPSARLRVPVLGQWRSRQHPRRQRRTPLARKRSERARACACTRRGP